MFGRSNNSKTLRTLGLTALTATLMSVGALVGFAAPASATAQGCTQWGAKKVLGHPVPTGQYCFTVSGSHTTVSWTSGSFNTVALGYPTEVVRFYNTRGNNYTSYTTFRGTGTLHGFHFWKTGIHGTAQVGSVCGELDSYGQTVARVCENIKR